MLQEKLTQKEQILRLHDKGLSQAEIARQIPTYTNYVWKVLHDHYGKTLPKRKKTTL